MTNFILNNITMVRYHHAFVYEFDTKYCLFKDGFVLTQYLKVRYHAFFIAILNLQTHDLAIFTTFSDLTLLGEAR